MTDLVDIFAAEAVEEQPNDNGGMDSLDFAEAVGLAETFLDIESNNFENMEPLFDDDDEAHDEAERVSLKSRNNEQNIPNFERMVMKKCGLL